VIFYDSDWNPAMDAQAQDRAHRIGQTREVHIYRLVSERTIEENILKKARQRRHLDFLAITAGDFTPEQMYNSDSLREMLGDGVGGAKAALPVPPAAKDRGKEKEEGKAQGQGAQAGVTNMSARDVQAAMNQMEDDADREAFAEAEKEGVDDMREFDESVPYEGGADGVVVKGEDGEAPAAMGEDELAAFQSDFGPDVGAIEARLKPVERFAFRFRTEVEEFKSLYWLSEEQRRREIEEEVGNEGEVDVQQVCGGIVGQSTVIQPLTVVCSADFLPTGAASSVLQVEMEAAEEEQRALEDGEMLATTMDMSPEAVLRQADYYRKVCACVSMRDKACMRAWMCVAVGVSCAWIRHGARGTLVHDPA
jgi:hypothetical protein